MKENEVIMEAQSCKGSFNSKIVRVGKLLFISHELPLDPETGQLITDDFKRAVKVCMENLRTAVEAEGTKIDNIVSATVYVENHDQVGTLEEFFSAFFDGKPPAKKIIEGHVDGRIPIQIDAVAIVR